MWNAGDETRHGAPPGLARIEGVRSVACSGSTVEVRSLL
jgi:hypothetical protein